ncbi:MAG: hypothetical protein ACFFE2_13150 [Candidatus Thorarchaeota archaeon]
MFGFLYIVIEIIILIAIIVWFALVKVVANTSRKQTFQKHRVNLMVILIISVTTVFALMAVPGVNGYPAGTNRIETEFPSSYTFNFTVIDSPFFRNRLYIACSYRMYVVETNECTFRFTKPGHTQVFRLTIDSTSDYVQTEAAAGYLTIEPGEYEVTFTTTQSRDIDVIIFQYTRDARDDGQKVYDMLRIPMLIGGVAAAGFFAWATGGWKSDYSEFTLMSPIDYAREKRRKYEPASDLSPSL